jgi:transposase
MPKAYPMALRERAVQLYAAGGTYESVASDLVISVSSVLRWVMLDRESGSVAPRGYGGGRRPAVDWHLLQQVLDEKPDAVTDELTRRYNARVSRADRVHRSSILRGLKRAGYVFKKNARGPQKRTDRTSGPSARPSSRGRPT